MAKIGLAYLGFAPIETEPTNALPTYGSGIKVGHAIKADLTVTNATGQLYADNMLVEDVSEFSSGTIAAETDNIPLATQALMYGATLVNDELGYGADDTAPLAGLGYYQSLIIGGRKTYRAFFYPKVKAQMGDDSSATKGNSITFGTYPVNFTVFAPEWGKWRYVKDFTTKEGAIAYIENKLNIATWYTVNVQVQGADSSKSAAPSGAFMVASGENTDITITGSPTALYDNGVERSIVISDGVYRITSVAEDHNVSVIFSA